MSVESLNAGEEEFYTNAELYWSEIPATIDGMLGGFGFISQTDIKGSKMLLKQLFNSKDHPERRYALDCGAGIGRISKFLLTELFEKVDMVEQNGAFLEQAKKYLGNKIYKIGEFYPVGLQNFQPESGRYDVIWVQWVLGHLTNADLIGFLSSCRKGLNKNGVIVVKENITSTDEVEKDENDSSVTRPLRHYHMIFQKANLHCYRQTKQPNFPKGLFPVYMFVLKPTEDQLENSSPENSLDQDNRAANSENCVNLKENISPENASNDPEKENISSGNDAECTSVAESENQDSEPVTKLESTLNTDSIITTIIQETK